MLDWGKMLFDGMVFALIGSVIVLSAMAYNPRLFLNKGDFPPDILAAVPPKTREEQRLAIVAGIPFLLAIIVAPLFSTWQFRHLAAGDVSLLVLALHAFGVIMVFNLFDLLVLDLLLFCTITPRFMVVPGTEGLAGYKDKRFHLRAHLRSIPAMAAAALAVALIASVL
ncbi:MAG: nitroreductase [Anaerolineae bacterium]